MTPTATRFVGAASFEGIVGAPVLVDEFERDPVRGAFPGDAPPAHDPIGHLEVAANADAFLVAPASANTIAKLAAGIADSILTTAFLACTAPRAVAPAMNDRMYEDAATQDNLRVLRERGVVVIDPESGPLASRGEHGTGRLPEPERLLAELETMLPGEPGPWDGMKVLVTAGGTREPIDAVRYVGNRSSGRMGFALAESAARRGAAVTLIAANVTLADPRGVRRIDVETAAGLANAVHTEFEDAHLLLMAAAVADFRPARAEAGRSPARTAARSTSGSRPRTTSSRPSRKSADPTRPWSRSRPSTGRRRREGAGEASSQGSRRDRRQRRLPAADRLRQRAQRGRDRRRGARASRPAWTQGGGRRRDPRSGPGNQYGDQREEPRRRRGEGAKPPVPRGRELRSRRSTAK